MTASRPRLLVILGPTGCGKSELAVAIAERIGGEIVGCDALQVYRGFDAGTAKPDADARRRVRHHLVDHVDPATDYNVADYVRDAETAIGSIDARGAVPLIVGGTGLYLRALLRGLIDAPGRDEALRTRLRRIVARGGAARLRQWLRRRDRASAERIPETDHQRLIRAVELVSTTGPTWSERLRLSGGWSSGVERFPNLKLGLALERASHRELLDRRVEGLFAGGLVREVERLLADGLSMRANAFRAIGYREVLAAIEAGADPHSVVREVQRNTRRYAKRQRSWFRQEPEVHWIDAAADPSESADLAIGLWRKDLSGRAS